MLCVSSVTLLCDSATPWTVAHQTPLSMGFPRQEYWSGLPFPTPKDLPNPEIEPISPMSPALQVDSFLLGKLLLTFTSMKEFAQNIIMITAFSHCCLFNRKNKKLLKLHASSFC